MVKVKGICGFALLATLLCSSAATATTITLQQGLNGYAGTTDAWLDESQTRDNYGGANDLRVQWNNGRSDCVVLKFDLARQIPPGSTILSATLSLWYFDCGSLVNDNAITIKPFRLSGSAWWDENVYNGQLGTGVSYRYRDIYESYEWTGGAEGGWWDKIDDANGVNKIKKTGGTPPDALAPLNWVPFDVTQSVRQWYSGATNNGFLVVATDFQGSGYIGWGLFFSRNEGEATYRPKLTISYDRPVAVAPITWSGIKAQYR